jgi:hypothetical protein
LLARVIMQFTCTNCDQNYEISPRAFGERSDTRTRCPGCRTWLILTRNAGDQLIATLDPTVAPPSGAAARPTGPTIAPARAPSAPTAVQSRGPTQPHSPAQSSNAAQPNPQDNAEIFFTPRIRPGSAAEKLGTGMATFALPDPAERLEAGKKKLQMQQVIQDFSVMFRLETKKSGRKQQLAAAAVAAVVIGGLWWALQAKVAADRHLDAAKDSKRLLAALVLQGGQSEQVAVLALPGDPTSPRATDAGGTALWPGTTLSRQCFLRVRQTRTGASRSKAGTAEVPAAPGAAEPEVKPAETGAKGKGAADKLKEEKLREDKLKVQASRPESPKAEAAKTDKGQAKKDPGPKTKPAEPTAAPPKEEPAKTEPVKTEPAEPEAPKADPPKADPPKADKPKAIPGLDDPSDAKDKTE